MDEFAHLWNGTDPGWKLHYYQRVEWHVTFPFASGGPTVREISKLRELLDEFRDLPVSDIRNRLRDRASYTLPETLSNLEMRSLIVKAERLGLTFTVDSVDKSGYLPMHANGSALIIEDDRLANEVARRMIAAGFVVETIHVD